MFSLEGQEGKLFAPLAFTKTYTIAAAAGLSVTLVPVLMGYLVRGRIPHEHANPINRVLIRAYRPLLEATLRRPWVAIGIAVVALVLTAVPLSRLGGEFMPPLDEGDLLYMPTALPGISADKASELLQQTDRLIKTVPEVDTVFGKSGRADTATDPAPLEMFETTIRFKPRSLAARHDAGEARRRTRSHGEGAGAVERGCRRSATGSTCCPPGSRRRSA